MKIRTWMLESLIVFTILAIVTILTGNKLIEWIGTFAVLFTFSHASVSNRLAEKQAAMVKPDVECYKWSEKYFLIKEILWFSYFILNHSYAALTGVIVFLIYPFWRKFYRKIKPFKPKK